MTTKKETAGESVEISLKTNADFLSALKVLQGFYERLLAAKGEAKDCAVKFTALAARLAEYGKAHPAVWSEGFRNEVRGLKMSETVVDGVSFKFFESKGDFVRALEKNQKRADMDDAFLTALEAKANDFGFDDFVKQKRALNQTPIKDAVDEGKLSAAQLKKLGLVRKSKEEWKIGGDE